MKILLNNNVERALPNNAQIFFITASNAENRIFRRMMNTYQGSVEWTEKRISDRKCQLF